MDSEPPKGPQLDRRANRAITILVLVTVAFIAIPIILFAFGAKSVPSRP